VVPLYCRTGRLEIDIPAKKMSRPLLTFYAHTARSHGIRDGQTGGGRLRVIATVQEPLAVQAILAHRARSGAPEPPGPAPPAPAAIA